MMRRAWPRTLALTIAASLFVLVAPPVRAETQYNVTLLPVPSGHQGSVAYGINDLGQIVGWSSTSGTNPHSGTNKAVVWQNGAVTALPLVNGTLISRAYGINSLGDIVGRSYESSILLDNPRPTLWSGGLATDLGILASAPYDWGSAYGINDSKRIVGESGTNNGLASLVYWNGGPPVQSPAVILYSYGYAINNAGTMVGQCLFYGMAEYHACTFSAGGVLTDMGTSLVTSGANDINNLGTIVGLSYFPGTVSWHAAMWVSGAPKDLGALGGNRSAAKAVNELNQVVGYYTAPVSGDYRAFLWDNDVMTDLNSVIPPNSGWTLEYAYDINDSGWIVGYGTMDGVERAYLLTPVPEPATLVLLGLGGLALIRWRDKP